MTSTGCRSREPGPDGTYGTVYTEFIGKALRVHLETP